MACPQCIGVERQFDESVARRELRRYRRRGPSRSTRLLLEGLESIDIPNPTFLDIGGGIGAIQHELMARGAAGGIHFDASPAYLAVSRQEAGRRGYADRVGYHEGDLVDAGDELPPADLVTLDRVLCCYHDMPALVEAAGSRARTALALVYPRQNALTRFGVRAVNLVMRLRSHPFRLFLHRTAEVDRRVAEAGLRPHWQSATFLWHVVVFVRPTDTGAGAREGPG